MEFDAVAPGSTRTELVEFASPFKSAPTVVCSIGGGAWSALALNIACQVASIDEAGMTVYVYNGSDINASKITVHWVAVGC